MTASPSDIRKAKKTLERMRAASMIMASISPEKLARIIELEQISANADGWPTGGEGKAAKPCTHADADECDNCPVETTSVEAAVFARMSKLERDGIGASCRLVLESIEEIIRLSSLAGRNVSVVFNARDQRRAAERADRCECCADLVTNQGDDRIRSGFCNACRVAWYRWKALNGTSDSASDRRRFKDERRGEVAA